MSHADPRQPHKTRIQWSRVIVVVIAAFFFVEVSLAFERKLILRHGVHARLLRTEEELDRLRSENIRLKEEKEALHRPEKIEELAREKLGLTKPHEIAVKIIKRTPPDASEQGKSNPPSKGLWEKFKEELPLKWLLK